MDNVIKVLEYFKRGLEDVEEGSGERQPMQDEIELALTEVKNNVVLGGVRKQHELLLAFEEDRHKANWYGEFKERRTNDIDIFLANNYG